MQDPADIEVFLEALRLPLRERSAYLGQACAADSELRQRVDVLLVAHERAGDFLSKPPAGVPTTASPAACEEHELIVQAKSSCRNRTSPNDQVM